MVTDWRALALRVRVLDAARNLGVLFDSQLSMSAQVSAVWHTDYYQLRQLRPLVWCLSEDAAKILIQAFINNRLDYCVSYFGITDGLIAACSQFRMLPHVSSPESGGVITSCQLYFSSTGCQSADEWIFKTSTLLNRSLAVYLSDECTLATAAGCHPLRSADNTKHACIWLLRKCEHIQHAQHMRKGQEIAQPVRWLLFCHRWANAV